MAEKSFFIKIVRALISGTKAALWSLIGLVLNTLDIGIGLFIVSVFFVLYGAICIPIALLADSIPQHWCPWVAYILSCWIAFTGIVLVTVGIHKAWRGESGREFVMETAWEGFKYCFLLFIGVTLQYAGIYWVLDRLCPGQHFLEKGGPFDWIYFSVMTVATVGYGDIKPTSGLARVLTSIQVVQGILLLGTFIGVLASLRSEEIRSGYASFWRRFKKMRNDFKETEETFGSGSLELWATTLSMGKTICCWLSEDLELREGFLNWLADDEWAQLYRFGARTKSNEIISFVAENSPLVEIINEFGKSESWDSWRCSKDPKTYVVTPEGFLEIYEMTLEGISAKQFVHMSVGRIPFGLDRVPFHFPDFTKPEPQEWREVDHWTEKDFTQRILAYFERFLLYSCSITTDPVFTFRFNQINRLPKRPRGKLNEEVDEYLDKFGKIHRISLDEIVEAINRQDIGKYNLTSRQSVAKTRAYKNYCEKNGKQ